MNKARAVLFVAAALLLVLFLTMFAGRLRSGEDPVRYRNLQRPCACVAFG